MISKNLFYLCDGVLHNQPMMVIFNQHKTTGDATPNPARAENNANRLRRLTTYKHHSSEIEMNILGISDEVTTCECCGKSGLKRTVVISCGDGMKFYGTSCASKAFKTPQDTIKKSASMFETAVKITKSYGLTAAKIGMTIAVSNARQAIETALRNAGYKTATTEQVDAVLARI